MVKNGIQSNMNGHKRYSIKHEWQSYDLVHPHIICRWA